MNLDTAEAIATLAKNLIDSIDRTKIPLPSNHYSHKWTHEDIDTFILDDGYITVTWSRYAGCGDYDREESNVSLSTLFDD